jgi:hypothetical protein
MTELSEPPESARGAAAMGSLSLNWFPFFDPVPLSYGRGRSGASWRSYLNALLRD